MLLEPVLASIELTLGSGGWGAMGVCSRVGDVGDALVVVGGVMCDGDCDDGVS